jgi:hypothetical protein
MFVTPSAFVDFPGSDEWLAPVKQYEQMFLKWHRVLLGQAKWNNMTLIQLLR